MPWRRSHPRGASLLVHGPLALHETLWSAQQNVDKLNVLDPSGWHVVEILEPEKKALDTVAGQSHK